MAATQTQLDALVEAYATGALRVRFADRDVTYRSKAEMRSQIREWAAALGVADPLASAASTPRVRLLRLGTGKGW